MLSACEIATNELTELLTNLPIRTEIVPRSGDAVYSFHEAKTPSGLRLAVSIERY